MTEEPTLQIIRIFDAPRELVYQCWADPKRIEQWSAPHGMTVDAGEGNFRSGGYWKSVMHGQDFDMPLQGDYIEVVDNEKIVFTHEWLDDKGQAGETTTITVTFKDLDSKTEMTFIQTGFNSDESREGHNGGWVQCFEKLETYLAEIQS